MYDEVSVGDRFTTASRTLTETDIVLFAGLTGDYAPLHTDEEFMKATPFGTRIAHGLLVLSVGMGLFGQLGVFAGTTLAFLGMEGLRFMRPVKPGDTVHSEVQIVTKRETSNPEKGIIGLNHIVNNQRGEKVLEANYQLMVRGKGHVSKSIR